MSAESTATPDPDHGDPAALHSRGNCLGHGHLPSTIKLRQQSRVVTQRGRTKFALPNQCSKSMTCRCPSEPAQRPIPLGQIYFPLHHCIDSQRESTRIHQDREARDRLFRQARMTSRRRLIPLARSDPCAVLTHEQTPEAQDKEGARHVTCGQRCTHERFQHLTANLHTSEVAIHDYTDREATIVSKGSPGPYTIEVPGAAL